MKFFYTLYLFGFRLLAQSPLPGWFGVSQARVDGFRESKFLEATAATEDTVLFHAASAGELEILIPLIEAFREQKKKMVVTVFSESALPALQKVTGLFHTGLSPREDEWSRFFSHFQIQQVFVSKYEAWPALWIECEKRKLPLVLINAQWRNSLAWAKRLIHFFGFSLPKLFLFAVEEREVSALAKQFPEAVVRLSSDPRWLRVRERKSGATQHQKVLQWQATESTAARPFGMVGSAWLEDLVVLVPALKKTSFAGTLWVIPHSLHPENLSQMKLFLQEQLPGHFVLVNEMGFLAELYSLADWVWVGGGFGKGIHSTMEPAVYAKPIACGPIRAHEFFEARELQSAGQLTICKNQSDAETWLKLIPFQSEQFTTAFLEKKTSDFSQSIELWSQIR